MIMKIYEEKIAIFELICIIMGMHIDFPYKFTYKLILIDIIYDCLSNRPLRVKYKIYYFLIFILDRKEGVYNIITQGKGRTF